MANILVEKEVLFTGIWRPHANTEHDLCLQHISSQFLRVKGRVSTYQLCRDGLRLTGTNDKGRLGKTEKILIQNIHDVTVNRYNSICLMTVYADGNSRYNFLVCRCQNEVDASHLVQTFRQYKKTLSGEGYKIDLKKHDGFNWTLKSRGGTHNANGMDGSNSDASSERNGTDGDDKEMFRRISDSRNGNQNLPVGAAAISSYYVPIDESEEHLEREPCEIDGKTCFNVAVQVELGDIDIDSQSVTSTTSFRSLKEELMNLSKEIRDIKFLLEKTTGISAAEYFKRPENDVNGMEKPLKLIPVSVNDDDEVPPSSPQSPNSNGDKHVNFAENHQTTVLLPDHDIRSFGVQTGAGQRKVVYTKRQIPPGYAVVRGSRSGVRSRTISNSSIPISPSSRSSTSDVFDMSAGMDAHTMHVRKDVRSPGVLTSTVEKPIEQVYNIYTRNFRNPRRKIVVMPGSATMPPLRRVSNNDDQLSPNAVNGNVNMQNM